MRRSAAGASQAPAGRDGQPARIAPTLDSLTLLGFDQVRRDAARRRSFAVRLLELLDDLREAAGPATPSIRLTNASLPTRTPGFITIRFPFGERAG